MTLPLNDGSAIVCRIAAHIQALAAVPRDDPRVKISPKVAIELETPLLVLAAMTLPLNDGSAIVSDPPFTSRHLPLCRETIRE